jgi:hypothetical protein
MQAALTSYQRSGISKQGGRFLITAFDSRRLAVAKQATAAANLIPDY